MFFVNVTIACITPTRECHDESPSLSQLSVTQRLTVFLFCHLVLFRLIALYLVAPGSRAGDTGIIYAVLSVSALFAQVCYGFIQDKLGLRKNCSGISPCY
jgi:OHS family lactose permease-like MFS transporter